MTRTSTLLPSLIVITFALAAASCRGGTSDQTDQGATSDSTAPATALALEWTDADLEKNVSRIGYGSKPKEILARTAEGALVFTPETPKDHVATAFVPLQPYSGERSLDLVLDVKAPGGETCLAYLQDQGYNVLGTVPCQAAGEQKATVKLPGGVTGVRVYFLSATRESLTLPARVRLVEHRS